jgi:16S rRNA processing protein RimM
MTIPDDLVLVGYVTGAYGVKGWVRIKPYSADADALLNAKTWWLDKPELRDVDMMQAKIHGEDVVAQLMGVAGRDAAEALKGTAVQIRRSHFPPLSDDEFYWIDLIGLAVENLQGESLGTVKDLMDNGAHPILRVAVQQPQGSVQGSDKAPQEMLIPFVDQFVKTVDQAAKKITVDWGLDY